MRRFASFALLALFAASAMAQQRPDYSRETLLEIFAKEAKKEEAERRFKHEFGAISFKALGMRWRVGYLPFFMPLHGSRPWINGERWPDPFILTGTEIARPPRTWRQTRDMNAELRRIEKRLKESATVKVNPE